MHSHTSFPLPPGSNVPLGSAARPGRFDILDRFDNFGPITGFVRKDKLTVFINGLELGRKFIAQHEKSLRVVTMKLEDVFPEGFLRAMTGKVHMQHRRELVGVIKDLPNSMFDRAFETIVYSWLQDYSTIRAGDKNAKKFRHALSNIATDMLLVYFFGAKEGSQLYVELREGYDSLGPDGLIWYPGTTEKAAFKRIHECLVDYSGLNAPKTFEDCIASRLLLKGPLSDSMWGNLIYMVEMGRFDLYSLFRWLTKYAADYPDIFAELSDGVANAEQNDSALLKCFVQETLRLDQSEKLARITTDEVIFEGYRIPMDVPVQICLWESHKNPMNFPNPFQFEPARFLHNPPGISEYSPFGLDRHQCPMDKTVIGLCCVFLKVLSQSFSIDSFGNGDPVRGLFHWQPPPDFFLDLTSRNK